MNNEIEPMKQPSETKQRSNAKEQRNHRNKQLNYTIIKLCYHRSNYLIIEITMLSSNRQCNHRIKQPNETSGQNNGATQKNNAIMELTMLSSKQLFNHRSNYLIIEITMLSSKQLFNHQNNYAIIEISNQTQHQNNATKDRDETTEQRKRRTQSSN
jgi:hypothetical protein